MPEKLKSFGYDKETFRIVEFCRLLSSRNGGQFFLGCRSLAGHFGLPVSTAANVLRMLVRDGVLEEVTKGALATPKGPLSTVYQFKGW